MFIRTSGLLPEGQEQLAAAWHLKPPSSILNGIQTQACAQMPCTVHYILRNVNMAWTETRSSPPHSDGDDGGVGFDRLMFSPEQAA